MDYEKIKRDLLKHARNAFETASTLHENQRMEVYLNKEVATASDVLEENEAIVYTTDKILCYQVYGHNFLEEEIKTWIDYARVEHIPEDGVPEPELTDIEKSVREIIDVLAKTNGVDIANVSSYEVFANLSMTLVGTIEHEIIEYWWSAQEEENGKKLALTQIEEALGTNPFGELAKP